VLLSDLLTALIRLTYRQYRDEEISSTSISKVCMRKAGQFLFQSPLSPRSTHSNVVLACLGVPNKNTAGNGIPGTSKDPMMVCINFTDVVRNSVALLQPAWILSPTLIFAGVQIK